MIKVAPSILSANFALMGDAVKMLNESCADYVHCDVMDGHFVPNLTFGQKMVADLKKISRLPMDVHLMIENPEMYVEEFAKAGADIITVHAEATVHLQRLLCRIKELGAKAGVSINPATPESAVKYVMNDVDLILVMSVNPGFGGQKFIPASMDKIRKIREMVDASGRNIEIEVDGGISGKNARDIEMAGATIAVAGSAVFSAADPKKAIEIIRG